MTIADTITDKQMGYIQYLLSHKVYDKPELLAMATGERLKKLNNFEVRGLIDDIKAEAWGQVKLNLGRL